MSVSSIESLKIKAKLLQKAKRRSQSDFALKDAYAIIAKTAGYASWKEMKDDYEIADILNPPHWSAQWKIWISKREEGLEYLRTDSHFLLPYHNQFFVCDSDYILSLGISLDDSDLKKVGRDWTAPYDGEAWQRLIKKIIKSHKQEHMLS